MKTRFVIWYVILIVLPAGLIAWMGSKALRHERQRLTIIAEQTLTERASLFADSLDLLFREAAESLLDDLVRLGAADPDTLHRWVSSQPFVRHVFVWHPTTGLLVPDLEWASPRDANFARRYEALFSGRTPWPIRIDAEETEAAATPPRPLAQTRQELARAVRPRAPATMDALAIAETSPADHAPQQGWLPWFWERDLHLLGWHYHPADNTVRGFEFEGLALISRLLPLFTSDTEDGTGFTLLDHHGDPVIQSPSLASSTLSLAPSISIPVSSLLPNWRLRATAPSVTATAPVLYAGLLLAAVLITLLCGGALLAAQALRQYRDAARKTTFVSNVSHELKTPLTTIRMYADMLREGRLRSDQQRHDYLDVIASESQRLTRLVNNVLDFSRIEQGRKTYRPEPLDLPSLINGVIAAQRPRLEEAGLTLNLHLPDTFPPLASDRDALEQVLLNLLDNAAKYAAPGELDLHLVEAESSLQLELSDQGPGVPPAHAERIFTSFHRVDDTLTARHPGAGLGLSIGRRLMRDLGGDLTYRPRPGGGAIFTITLPRENPS